MQTNDAPGVTASAAVAQRVTTFLAEHERSRAWLARQLPMTEATLSRRLAGQQPWTLLELEQLERVLGIPVDRLVARDVDDDEDPFDDAPSDDARLDYLASMADTGSARVVGLLAVVVLAVVVGWVAPYGVPVAALLAVGVWAVLLLAMVHTVGPRPRAVVALVVAAVVAAGIGVAVPADAHGRHRGHEREHRIGRGDVRLPIPTTSVTITRRPRPTLPPGVTPTLPTVRPTSRPTVTLPTS